MSNKWITLIGVLAALCIVCYSDFVVQENCLLCICARNDCQKRVNRNCTDGVCGPYYISKQYYELAGSPGDDYESCTKTMECSVQCVLNFLYAYAEPCTYPRQPRCTDCNRMHWSGSTVGCRTLDFVLDEQRVQLANLPLQDCCDMLGNCD